MRNRLFFRNKKNGEKIVRRKARLVVKGCNQKNGIDFDTFFSHIVRMTSIRTALDFSKNGADMFKKVVPRSKLEICRKLARMSFK